MAVTTTKSVDTRLNTNIAPTSIALPTDNAAVRLRSQIALETFSPVNQNGSFEFDRVIKSGYVQKRTQKTKVRDAHMCSTVSVQRNFGN